jgi:large subunit ribosomal protein L22
MEVKALLRNYRKSARKVKPVIDLIRGRGVADAEAQLMFVKREAAPQILKLLKSAIANAVHNNHLDPNNLYVKEITANQGTTIKRFDPRAMGRAYTIRKRTSHITLVLGEKIPTAEVKKEVAKEAKSEGKAEAKVEKKPVAKKAVAKKTTK